MTLDFYKPYPIRLPLESRQDICSLSPHTLQLTAIDSQRLQYQRCNLLREDPLCELPRLCDLRTANEASYIPVIGAQTAVLFDLLFGGCVDDPDVGLDDDVGHEGAVDGVTETWISSVSETD